MAAIIFLALGALMLYFAVEIGMRRRIAFLHDYHYQNMKEEDITPYLHLMGVGLAVVGICFVAIKNPTPMKILYITYQVCFALPILLVLTILTALVTIIGSLIGGAHISGYYPGTTW